MPTVLGRKYDTFFRGKYPQMLEEDWPVWDRFLELYSDIFLWFYYSVKVGGQINLDPKIPDNIAKAWYDSTAKRIDVLGEKENEIWIVEVTTQPGLRAVGQILSYFNLWILDPKIDKPIVNVLVAERLDPDLEYVLYSSGIKFFSV